MSSFPGCEASVHTINPTAKVCDTQHCDTFTISDDFHKQCEKFGKF